MKIKKQLPQFSDEGALLAVLGGKEGVFYFAEKGNIEKIGSCAVHAPKYSDKEGFFRVSNRGGANASGSVKETDKQGLQKDFVKTCMAELKRIEKDFSAASLYLFIPSPIKNLFQTALPARLKNKLRKIKTGNHHEKHPFELLEMLQVKR